MLSLYTTDWAAAVTPSALHHDFENNSALSEAKLTEVLNHGNAALADKTWLDYDGLSVLSTATGEPGRFMLVHHSRTTTNQDGEERYRCVSAGQGRIPHLSVQQNSPVWKNPQRPCPNGRDDHHQPVRTRHPGRTEGHHPHGDGNPKLRTRHVPHTMVI